MYTLLHILVITGLIAYSKCKIPEYIQVCPENHSNMSVCIMNSIKILKPRLKIGIPELDVPALEPLHINKISFYTGSEASSVATNVTNIKIWGASRFQILKLSVHPNENGKTFEFEVTVPHLYIEGHYETNTKILFLDLKGNGPFKANISQYQFECTLKGLIKSIHDINHLKFESLKCKVSMGEKKLQLENLFAINPLIAKATNDIIDDNTDALFLEITPGLKKSIQAKFLNMANKITLAFKYEELFP